MNFNKLTFPATFSLPFLLVEQKKGINYLPGRYLMILRVLFTA
jgi:hypothetical protein